MKFIYTLKGYAINTDHVQVVWFNGANITWQVSVSVGTDCDYRVHECDSEQECKDFIKALVAEMEA